MWYITEHEYEKKLKHIQQKNKSKERLKKLREEKKKVTIVSTQKRKFPSTSKIVLWAMIVLCLEIVFFCEYIMFVTKDLTALYALIGIVATLIPIVLGYMIKSKAENTSGGIVYETAMAQMNQDNICHDEVGTNSSKAQG